ncbi:DUF2971 domain-containing protein [Vibrio lentus]
MRLLFRYRDYNENTVRELIESELWHSHIRHLNDPFEHPFQFDWDEVKIENFGKIASSIGWSTRGELIDCYLEGNTKQAFKKLEHWLKIQSDFLKLKMSETFICCFSRKCDEPLMWSHYSNGMQGLCFIYDEKMLINSDRLKLKEATYNTSVDKLTYRDFPADTTKSSREYSFESGRDVDIYSTKRTAYYSNDLSYQKHERWKYEEEVRSVLFADDEIENQKAGVIEKIPAEALKGVIIGSKMDKTNRKVIESLCKERGIPVHVATPDRENYTVNINPSISY